MNYCFFVLSTHWDRQRSPLELCPRSFLKTYIIKNVTRGHKPLWLKQWREQFHNCRLVLLIHCPVTCRCPWTKNWTQSCPWLKGSALSVSSTIAASLYLNGWLRNIAMDFSSAKAEKCYISAHNLQNRGRKKMTVNATLFWLENVFYIAKYNFAQRKTISKFSSSFFFVP